MQKKQNSNEKTFEKYQLFLTPLEIIRQQPSRNNPKKCFIIKIGNQSARCQALGQTISFILPAPYSQTLKKFYPIKGIIKINDIMQDNTQITLGVGGFRADEILNKGHQQIIVTEQVGPITLKMKVKVVLHTNQTTIQNPKQEKQQNKINTQQCMGSKMTESQRSLIEGLTENNLYQQSPQSFKGRLNSEREESGHRSLTESKLMANITKQQLGRLQQRLISQRQKNQRIQESLEKANIKNDYLLTKLVEIHQNYLKILQYYQKFKNSSKLDSDGIINIQINDILKQLRIQYNSQTIKQHFLQFVKLLNKFTNQNLNQIKLFSRNNHSDLSEIKIINKINQLENEKIRLIKQCQEKDNIINNFNNSDKNNIQKKLSNQTIKLQQQIKQLKKTNNQLSETVIFYKEKINICETQINHRQIAFQSLIKEQVNYKDQISFLQSELNKKLKVLENCNNIIDEKNQQISNLNEVLQKYRNKYGQISTKKNRALENQIKQCLRWIESQNNLQLNESRDTVFSQMNHSQSNTISDVIKNIEIQTLPIQEIGGIRNQLLKILQRVDQLLETPIHKIN